MLRLATRSTTQDCSGVSRRDFLQIGSLALAGAGLEAGWSGLSLPWQLRQEAAAAELGLKPFVKDRAVVVLFLSGGPSHIETFNPNMDGIAPSRSATGAVKTTVPGLAFGGTFPKMAQYAHEMAIVRSFQHAIGGHVQAIVHVLTGGTDPLGQRQEGYSMGAGYARLRGSNHERSGMPTFSLLNSDEVDPQYRSERGRVERASHPGELGSAFGPFVPGSGGPTVENMQLRMDSERLDDRRSLLTELDGLRRRAEQLAEYEGADQYTRQAFDVILGSAAEAFDLSQEHPRTIDSYDTSEIQVGKKKFRPSRLGRHMLTARRLIEAGCGYVTVHSAGWDMHADGNNPGIVQGMNMLGSSVDKAVAAFLEDLKQRGLLDKVLLVITGDFGRTPKINGRGGRDHWPRLCTLAFAGGGVCRGQVIGQSARKNDAPATSPIGPGRVMATVMHSLFDVAALRVMRGLPRQLLGQLEEHRPIEELDG